MQIFSINNALRTAPLLGVLILGGCVLAPPGTADEHARLRDAGEPFETPVDQRPVPELASPTSWRDVLHRALLTNGELEASYFEWKASLETIPQVANYPNTNLAPSFSYMFSSDRMKSFDRTTVNIGFDSMESLSFPAKVSQAGKVALAEARAAGGRFLAKKFEIQRRILTDYLELALLEEKIRIGRDNVALLQMLVESAQSRVQAGGNQVDLLRAQTEHRLAENDLSNLLSQRQAMQARLNGMLSRDPQAPLTLPPGLPEPRPIAADDAALILAAVDQNPELAVLARSVEGRADAIELAKMEFIPDINPMVGFTGSLSQMVGAMVVLPTTIPEIRGRINEARAMLRAGQAMLRQTRSERAAGFVAALVVLRNSERQVNVFEETILPRAQQVLASSRQNYAAGAGSFMDLIDAQRTVLDVRLMIAEARIEREKQLAELEALAGVDVETLGIAPTTAASTRRSLP